MKIHVLISISIKICCNSRTYHWREGGFCQETKIIGSRCPKQTAVQTDTMYLKYTKEKQL